MKHLLKTKISKYSTVFHQTLVWADALLLEMIIDNLVSNAIKYNKIDGVIFFSWEGATKTLTITDEGIELMPINYRFCLTVSLERMNPEVHKFRAMA